jgi:uncharacterized protein YyaL (SSP411 family)
MHVPLQGVGDVARRCWRVMTRESFADPTGAALMNEGLIRIKVDRQYAPTWIPSTGD